MKLLEWVRRRDPGLGALRRAARAALVMPSLFAFGDKVAAQPEVATFAAFGAFAMLLLVDFTGPMRVRVQAHISLAVAGAVLVCIATALSRWPVPAAVAMAVVGFVILFSGSVSSVLAASSTALLIAFILPVSLSAPLSALPDRLEGWALASLVCTLAVVLLWPAPVRNPLRAPLIAACRALADRIDGAAEGPAGSRPDRATPSERERLDAAEAAVRTLRAAFFGTPYRPTGLSTSARALVRLVDEVGWLNTIAQEVEHEDLEGRPRTIAVSVAAAAVLREGAELLSTPARGPSGLRAALATLEAALSTLEAFINASLPRGFVVPVDPLAGSDHAVALASSLDPTFRAQELSFAVRQSATNIDFATAAEGRSWLARLLGRHPAGFPGALSSAQERASSYLERHSVWLHNSIRGAIGLGAAVLIADLTSVQHAFWVVLGTLSVLRSNALSTGQNILRAVGGTLVGFVVGAIMLAAVGTNTVLLWALLPIAVLFAGFAPAAISFAAGQAGFTLTLVILFNLAQPLGWRVGLVRVEDIALGCGVSLAVGLLFWPRGAAGALGRALAESYAECASYLAEAVSYGMSHSDDSVPGQPAPSALGGRAAAAARRLDDAFRGYLAERGTKPVPLAEMTSLLTGVAGLRLVSEAIVALWQRDGGGVGGDRSRARYQLLETAQLVTSWYQDFANALIGSGDLPEPQVPEPGASAALVSTVVHDLGSPNDAASATAVRMVWTGDHLDAARRLQRSLFGPARAAKEQRALVGPSGFLSRLLT